MVTNKIIRTICYFAESPSSETISLLDKISEPLIKKGYEIQTKRICSPSIEKIKDLDSRFTDDYHCFAVGSLNPKQIQAQFDNLLNTKDVSFNTNLTDEKIGPEHIQILSEIIKKKASKTFNFAYTFNNPPSTPFFPSAHLEKEGFSIGLQPTNLTEDCITLEDWFEKLKNSWGEIYDLFKENKEFFGIDSSIAPLYTENGSLINFIKKLGVDFSQSITTNTYLRITEFLKDNNPKPVGLCGLMFPCLEDFELADEYETGNFGIERNLFLSLHCGLGIDTYPIGVDENPQRVLEILLLVQGLSKKYQKPLSVRFVSDGKIKIGKRSDFQNQFLKDVVVRPL